MAKKIKNAWRVYYGTEENLFECEHEDFATLEEAQAWVRENVKNDIKVGLERLGESVTEDELNAHINGCINEYGADTEDIVEYRYIYAIGMIGKTCRAARKIVDDLRSEYKEMFF
jgi:hypothetical protein